MKIAVVGIGYVGLVSAACFAEMGIDVTCVDIDAQRIQRLRQGQIPIYEPGLQALVTKNARAGRLHFTTSLASVLAPGDPRQLPVEVVFSAVGTPPDDDGGADLRQVLEVARTFGSHIQGYTLLVTKSTVPVGTAAKVRQAVAGELERRGAQVPFDVASNPEFLKEGAAIKDFMSPDRVVVGADSDRARRLLTRLYKPFMLNGERFLITDIPSAEMIKYAANSMLATRISFMNDIANLCELVGADVNMVRKGIGSDQRIGSKFLYAGCGYGGSCFPKDIKALIHTGREQGYQLRVLEAVEAVNDHQKELPYQKLRDHYASLGQELRGKTVALWGLAFKPETDDMRQAPSLVVIDCLLRAGASVKVYDPVAMDECRRRLGSAVTYCKDMYEAAVDAHALVLVTEWREFRVPSFAALERIMADKVLVDGRNIYDAAEAREHGFAYYRIG